MAEERENWLLLGVLFLSNFFVIGSSSAITGVFLTPLVRHFGWTRTLAASLTMLLALTGALAGPMVGRLLDSEGRAGGYVPIDPWQGIEGLAGQ